MKWLTKRKTREKLFNSETRKDAGSSQVSTGYLEAITRDDFENPSETTTSLSLGQEPLPANDRSKRAPEGYIKISEEKRMDIINGIHVLGKTMTEAAELYRVKRSTVSSIMKVFTKENRIRRLPMGGNRRCVLSNEQKALVLQWVDSDCTLTLQQISLCCIDEFAMTPSKSVLSRTLRDFHYTIKRLSIQPARRNTVEVIIARKAHAEHYIEPMPRRQETFFVDETGFNISMRQHSGRSFR
jgi:transposase